MQEQQHTSSERCIFNARSSHAQTAGVCACQHPHPRYPSPWHLSRFVADVIARRLRRHGGKGGVAVQGLEKSGSGCRCTCVGDRQRVPPGCRMTECPARRSSRAKDQHTRKYCQHARQALQTYQVTRNNYQKPHPNTAATKPKLTLEETAGYVKCMHNTETVNIQVKSSQVKSSQVKSSQVKSSQVKSKSCVPQGGLFEEQAKERNPTIIQNQTLCQTAVEHDITSTSNSFRTKPV